MAKARRSNPYVGPYAFAEKDAERFFGRGHETETLRSLIVAERIILFCAQSGAGKTSLVNAKLVPELRKEEGLAVLPLARVTGEPSLQVAPRNVFTFNVLKSLSGERLPQQTLDGYLKAELAGRSGEPLPRVLILDQFEEILTSHPEHREQREDFFRQVRRALRDDPALAVVFVMREDRIAGLDPYIPILGQLRTRFRMERLRPEQAVQAIREPAEKAGRPFDPGVAEQLVADLCQVRLAEQDKPVPGEFVEPVQLQVVCFQLWENLGPGDRITGDDLKAFGNVDQALELYYETAVKRTARAAKVSASQIRHFCGTKLITPGRIRSQVSREGKVTGGLPNKAIDELVDIHLLRPEATRGGIWYELAHDRLIDPILKSNQAWLGAEKSQLAKDARAWQTSQDPSFLYRGLRLAEAQRESQHRELGELEHEFLDAAQESASQQRRRYTQRLGLVIAAQTIALMATAFFAFTSWREGRIASSRAVASAALNVIESDPELALRLSLLALEKARTITAEEALHRALQATRVHKVWTVELAPVSAVAMSPDGRLLALVGSGDQLSVWDTRSRRQLVAVRRPSPAPESPALTSLAFDAGGNRLASGDTEGHIVVSGPRGEILRELAIGEDWINSVAWSPNGELLAVATNNSTPTIWHVDSGRQSLQLQGHTEAVWQIGFSNDGRYLATAGDDERAILWDARSARQLQVFAEKAPVTGIAVSSAGNRGRIAVLSVTTVSVWEFAPDSLLRNEEGAVRLVMKKEIATEDKPTLRAAFNEDGETLAVANLDGTLRFWDVGSGRQLYSAVLGSEMAGIAFAKDLQSVAMAAGDSSLPAGAETGPTLWKVEGSPALSLPGGAVAGLAFRDGGGAVTAVTQDGASRRWMPASGRVQPSGHCAARSPAVQIAVSADGRHLACAGEGGQVEIWRLESPPSERPLRELRRDGVPADLPLALSADGRVLAAETGRGVRVWDFTSGRSTLLASELANSSLAVAENGKRLAAAGEDGVIRIWEVPANRIVTELPFGGNVESLALSADGERVAAVNRLGLAWAWEIASRRAFPLLPRQGSRISAVAFSPAGRRVATASTDASVKIWDAERGRELFSLRSYPYPVERLAFSPDGRHLALATRNSTLGLETLDLDELIRLAEARRPRQLPTEERQIYLED